MIWISFDIFDELAWRAQETIQVTTLTKLLSCQLPDSQTIRGPPLSSLSEETLQLSEIQAILLEVLFLHPWFWYFGMHALDMKKKDSILNWIIG